MKGIIKNLVACLLIFLYSCATSMTPMQVNDALPTFTKSTYLSPAQAKNSNCKCLTQGRSYTAPMGSTVKNDLRNGVVGIDQWVSIDGGNAYKLVNYKWVTVSTDKYGVPGSTQLVLDFDTYFCQYK